MGLGTGRPPLFGLDEAEVRFIDVHETRAHAIGGRVFRDLDDCVLLHAPNDRQPFFNRVAGMRWPTELDAFDRRLAEIVALFAGLDRRPHVWTPAAFPTPPDIGERLRAHGFRDLGGGFVMLLVRPPAQEPTRLPAGVAVERLDGGPGVTVSESLIREVAWVQAGSFAVELDQLESVEAETLEALTSPAFHLVLVRSGGLAVALGKRYTFDGASYLSSIGTLPGERGRGYGSIVTNALIRNSLAAQAGLVYLGVYASNDRAIEVYRRAGLEILGGRAGDYLLV